MQTGDVIMNVLYFMNTNDDWEQVLTNDPYNIKVSRDGKYVLLKYQQFNSDLSIPIVRECRGAIFYDNNGKYECVCRAFDKFGNYGESYAAAIDWNSVVVQEKIDGSLIKLYHHGDTWHIATNGTIDAFKANVGDFNLSFGDLVHKALGGEEQFKLFCQHLDTDYTYMFELVSPMSIATIYYADTKLYYLGQRDMTTMIESNKYQAFMEWFGVLKPKIYHLNSIDGCLEYVNTMTRDEEGFVIVDNRFNRIKLKSPEYLLAFHMTNNGEVTTKRIINMIKNEQIDDFLAYCPQYKDMVDNVVNAIVNVCGDIAGELFDTMSYVDLPKKEFAAKIKNRKHKDFLFKFYDNHDIRIVDYIMKKPTSKIVEMIRGNTNGN